MCPRTGRGDRSLPSCLGGGDLDGDIYNLILNVGHSFLTVPVAELDRKPDLFPTRTVDPGSYRSLPHKETEGPCTVSDVAEFVINYVS
jgi:RNA-dependent RNA polymerase